jgi:predicted nucleic acid-binding protein
VKFGFLLDTSAFWHLTRSPEAMKAWEHYGAEGLFHVSEPTRAEILYSAENAAHRDEMAGVLDILCEPAPVPKDAWRWVDVAQYKLTLRSQHRCPGPIDLLVAATAVHHGFTVLHVDNDFLTIASALSEVQQQDIRN